MKYLLIALTMFSIALSNCAYAEKETKKNSFGDKNYKYKAQYKKNSSKSKTRTKIDQDIRNDENSSPKSGESDRSEEEYEEYLDDKNS
jgi:hypothetical protein